MFEHSLQLVEEGVKNGIFPSAALAIGVKDRILVKKAWGRTCIQEPSLPIGLDTQYDMASLSKVIGASMICFHFLEKGQILLKDTVGDFFEAPEDKQGITILQLMTHTSGMEASFYLGDFISDPKDTVRTILEHPLAAAPGTQTIYSCMGYILFAKILEKVGGLSLDRLAEKCVFQPLGMNLTTYRPSKESACTEWDAAAGEYLCGVVHDENSRFLNGSSGNAGIFSTINDMALFGAMLACGGIAGQSRYLSAVMLSAATQNYTPGCSENRGLGFKLKGGEGEFMGNLFSEKSFGHTGFTGTSLAVDPESGLFVILLTNRVHPTRDNNRIVRFRNLLHNCIAAEFS